MFLMGSHGRCFACRSDRSSGVFAAHWECCSQSQISSSVSGKQDNMQRYSYLLSFLTFCYITDTNVCHSEVKQFGFNVVFCTLQIEPLWKIAREIYKKSLLQFVTKVVEIGYLHYKVVQKHTDSRVN